MPVYIIYNFIKIYKVMWTDATGVNANQAVAAGGNDKARETYERHVPPCYRRPQPSDPQWVFALRC